MGQGGSTAASSSQQADQAEPEPRDHDSDQGAPVAEPQDDKWARVGPTPIASLADGRHQHAAVCFGGEGAASVLVVGGEDTSTNIVRSSEVYAVGSNTWRALPAPLPTARRLCGACVVANGAVVVVGGTVSSFNPVGTVEAFDSRSGEWSELPPLPEPLLGCGVAALGDTVFVVGGSNADASDQSAVWALDTAAPGGPAQWRQQAAMSTARFYPGCAADPQDNRVFVCGGYNRNDDYLGSCEVFALATGEWAPLPSLPTPLSQCGCGFAAGTVFVVGGYNDDGNLRGVFALDAAADAAWHRLQDSAVGRNACSAVCVGRALLVFGGEDDGNYHGVCERFEF